MAAETRPTWRRLLFPPKEVPPELDSMETGWVRRAWWETKEAWLGSGLALLLSLGVLQLVSDGLKDSECLFYWPCIRVPVDTSAPTRFTFNALLALLLIFIYKAVRVPIKQRNDLRKRLVGVPNHDLSLHAFAEPDGSGTYWALNLYAQHELRVGATFSGVCVEVNGVPASWVLAWGVDAKSEEFLPPRQERPIFLGHVYGGRGNEGNRIYSVDLLTAGMTKWTTPSGRRRSEIRAKATFTELPITMTVRISAHDFPVVSGDVVVEIGADSEGNPYCMVQPNHNVGNAVSSL